jgi:hypothetical protein
VDGVLGHSGVTDDLFHWGDGVLEETHAELLEFGSGDGQGEIFGFSQGVHLDGGLG